MAYGAGKVEEAEEMITKRFRGRVTQQGMRYGSRNIPEHVFTLKVYKRPLDGQMCVQITASKGSEI